MDNVNVAEKYIEQYENSDDTKDGFMMINPIDFIDWSLVAESKRLCEQSYDSNISIRFMDGSRLELVNPKQRTYRGYMK